MGSHVLGTRPPSRRISRWPEKKCGLAAGKIAASRQPSRKKYAAKPPPKVRLKAALPRNVNEKLAITVQSSYDHVVNLQCCTKIGRSVKIILFRTLWTIHFYVQLYVVTPKSDTYPVLENAVELPRNAELIDFSELIIMN